MKVLEARNDVNILQATKDLYFTDDDVFNYEEHNLNWAVAFTEFNSNTEYELPADIGKIVFKAYSWGVDADGKPFTKLEELDQHPCSADELAINGADHPDATFFKVHESADWYIKTYQKKFVCFSPKDLFVYGDFSTFKARQLQMMLRKCEGAGCKSDAEITKFFKNKFLLVLSNSVRFDSEGFFESSAIRESRINWLPINT